MTPRSSSRLNSRITAQAPTNPSSSHRMEKMKSFWGSGTNRCFWRLLPSPSPTAPPEPMAYRLWMVWWPSPSGSAKGSSQELRRLAA